MAAVDLMTALLRDVLAHVTERHGGAPDTVALTHPANWGQFKIDLLRQAADELRSARRHARDRARRRRRRLRRQARASPVGDIVAVYDLGGGTFDAAVLRRTATGFETLGEPVGLERLGGIDFDHAVVAHVERTIAGDPRRRWIANDPEIAAALIRLRQDCVTAKEGLSEDSDVVVPVALPGVWSDVRLTRGEFEQMIAPALIEPLRAFRRGLAVAGVSGVRHPHGPARRRIVACARSWPRRSPASWVGPSPSTPIPKHAVALGAARIVGTTGDRGHADRDRDADRDVDADRCARRAPAPSPPPSPAAARTRRPPARALRRGRPSPAWPLAAARRRRRRVRAARRLAGFVVALGGGADQPVPTLDGHHRGAPASTAPSADRAEYEPATTVDGARRRRRPVRIGERDVRLHHRHPAGRRPLRRRLRHRPASIRSSHGEDAGATEHDHHVHFFFDTTAPGNAGANGRPPGSWELWGRQRGRGELVFDEFTVDDAGDAEQLCVAVATSGHEVLADADRTGNCVDLPIW